MKRRVLLTFFLAALMLCTMISPAFAWTYSRVGAQIHADIYWNTWDTAYVFFDGHDCTNFTSQAMHNNGGHIPDDNAGSRVWYYYWTWPFPTYSRSWSVVGTQYDFLKNDGRGTVYNQASSLSVGDIIYYDWTNDGYLDHSAVVVAKDTNSRPRIDAHSNNRYHAFWDLKAYGAPATTRYVFMHVASSG